MKDRRRQDGPRGGAADPGQAGAARAAAWWILPYVVLALVWIGSNPPAAAPDEDAHLIKALGVARLDIGVPYTGPVDPTNLGNVRNASIGRVVTIPARLAPQDYPCFRFRVDITADCQPHPDAAAPGEASLLTTIGAYPPFAYPPFGLAAQTAATVPDAFLRARLVVLAEAALLLWLACWHLIRWLGRHALFGVALFLTPMAVFCMAILNTSGLEIFGALGVAAVVVVALRRPESLAARGTAMVTLVSGLALVVSRQLGAVTLAALVLVLLATGGWRPLWLQVRAGSRLVIAVIVVLGLATLAVAGWELKFDHPALLGPWASRASLRAFLDQLPQVLHEGVGWFGWLDVQMPAWSTWAWTAVLGLLVVVALVLGAWRERLVLLGLLGLIALVAYVTYARVFYPIGAGLQGRHLLPMFALVPVLSGVIVTERLRRVMLVRLFTGAALVLVPLQLFALYLNGKRYAVGLADGPSWFVPDARWAPPLGWYPWLALAAVAAALMIFSWWRWAQPGRDRLR